MWNNQPLLNDLFIPVGEVGSPLLCHSCDSARSDQSHPPIVSGSARKATSRAPQGCIRIRPPASTTITGRHIVILFIAKCSRYAHSSFCICKQKDKEKRHASMVSSTKKQIQRTMRTVTRSHTRSRSPTFSICLASSQLATTFACPAKPSHSRAPTICTSPFPLPGMNVFPSKSGNLTCNLAAAAFLALRSLTLPC